MSQVLTLSTESFFVCVSAPLFESGPMRIHWISRALLASLLTPVLLNAQAVVYKTKIFEKTTDDV